MLPNSETKARAASLQEKLLEVATSARAHPPTTSNLSPMAPRAVEDAKRLQSLLAKRSDEQTALGASNVARESGKLMAAMRLRTLLHSRLDVRVQAAMLKWKYALQLVEDAGNTNSLQKAGDLLEAALHHLRPAVLGRAFRMWAYMLAAMQREIQREEAHASHTMQVQHGKWAMQRAFSLELSTREKMTKSILQWWEHGELSRGWSRFLTALAAWDSAER